MRDLEVCEADGVCRAPVAPSPVPEPPTQTIFGGNYLCETHGPCRNICTAECTYVERLVAPSSPPADVSCRCGTPDMHPLTMRCGPRAPAHSNCGVWTSDGGPPLHRPHEAPSANVQALAEEIDHAGLLFTGCGALQCGKCRDARSRVAAILARQSPAETAEQVSDLRAQLDIAAKEIAERDEQIVTMAEETAGVLARSDSAYVRQLATVTAERDEKAAIIAAIGHEKDALRATASAADGRRVAAEHRAKRIVLDAELVAQLATLRTAAEALQAELDFQFGVEPDDPSATGLCVKKRNALRDVLAKIGGE